MNNHTAFKSIALLNPTPNRASQRRSAANALPIVHQDVQLRPAAFRGSGGRLLAATPRNTATLLRSSSGLQSVILQCSVVLNVIAGEKLTTM